MEVHGPAAPSRAGAAGLANRPAAGMGSVAQAQSRRPLTGPHLCSELPHLDSNHEAIAETMSNVVKLKPRTA